MLDNVAGAVKLVDKLLRQGGEQSAKVGIKGTCPVMPSERLKVVLLAFRPKKACNKSTSDKTEKNAFSEVVELVKGEYKVALAKF